MKAHRGPRGTAKSDVSSLADEATFHVCVNLNASLPEIAGVMQPVAFALWGASLDGSLAAGDVRCVVEAALEDLGGLVRSEGERRFLRRVLTFLAPEASTKCGESIEGRSPKSRKKKGNGRGVI